MGALRFRSDRVWLGATLVAASLSAAPSTQPARPEAPAPPAAVAPAEPTLADSPAARTATSKYEHDLEQARKDFENRNKQLRQEYETKVAAARKAYIAGLESAQADETHKNKLELALTIKNAIARLKAEGPPIWPKQALPDASPVTVATTRPAVAQKASATVKGAKPLDASRGHRFDFSNEKLVREEWSLPSDTAKWQLADGGVTIKSDRLDSRFTLHGDCTIALQYVLADYAHCWLTFCGEEIPLPEARKKVIEVVIERKGDTLTMSSSLGANKSYKIKEAALDAPSPLSFRVTRDIGLRGVIVKAKELVKS